MRTGVVNLKGYETKDGTSTSVLHILLAVAETAGQTKEKDQERWERVGVKMVDAGAKDEGAPGSSILELAVRGGWKEVATRLVAASGSEDLVAGNPLHNPLHTHAPFDPAIDGSVWEYQEAWLR